MNIIAPPGFTVTQWFKNGDMPDDGVGDVLFDPLQDWYPYKRLEGKVVRFYRHPNIDGRGRCSACGRLFHDHGWIDQGEDGAQTVCPGAFVLTNIETGKMIAVSF